MKIIYKYPLNSVTTQTLTLPIGATILSVKNVKESICVYAVVDNQQKTSKDVEILILGTGQRWNGIVDTYLFLDTVKLADGGLMFHVFYK